ncbi:hypothetical protein BDD12DRAFT_873792 [Trichophaea hybrida]|nr:hypothetical protein BDD12DRAFT_873792 [Trichophaea hybrida]
MVQLQQINGLELVLDTPKGRGIFATRLIPAGTVIDTAPVILLGVDEFNTNVQYTDLLHYSYNWPVRVGNGKTELHQAIVLGLGSMFNHSLRRQNVGWKRNLDAQVVVYTALKDIEAGQELLISYGLHLTFIDVEEQQGGEQEEEDPLGKIALDL